MLEISSSYEELLKIFKKKDTRELEEIQYLESSEYTDDALTIIREILKTRSDRIIGITHKYCQICKRIIEIEKKICPCGYNFEKPNIGEINLVRNERVKKNRKMGIVMILVGIILLLVFGSDNYSNPYRAGIPGFIVLIGIYKFFTGKTVKKPTNSVFDSVLGDSEDTKDIKEDISYLLCPSCNQQILLELNYKNCPNCGAKIPESRVMDTFVETEEDNE